MAFPGRQEIPPFGVEILFTAGHHNPKRPLVAKRRNRQMATMAAVYSVDAFPRTPEDVVAALFRERPRPRRFDRPKPCHKRMVARLAKIYEDDRLARRCCGWGTAKKTFGRWGNPVWTNNTST